MVETIRSTRLERFIGWFGKTFFERSGYKADLHADLHELILEIKTLNTMVYSLISEYKNVVTIYKLNKNDTQQRRLK